MIDQQDEEPGDDQSGQDSRPGEKFLQEIGGGIRPYVVAMVKAFLIASLFWILMYIFEKVVFLLPVEGLVATIVGLIHGIGTVAAFAIFSWIFVADIFQIQRLRR